MKDHLTSALKRLSAIAVAGMFTYGGLRLVLGDSLMHPAQWTDYQVLTLLLVAGTISAGHFVGTAWRSSAYLSMIGFAVVFVTGTYLAARQSLDRQADTAAASTLSAEDANAQIADKRSDLAKAKARKDHADRKVAETTDDRHCGRGCKDWKQNAKDVAVVIAQLEREIAALGPRKPVNAGAEYLGNLGERFGYAKVEVISLDALLLPFLKFFMFEIGSIVSLGFALRHEKKRPASIAAVEPDKPSDTQLPDDADLEDIRKRFFEPDKKADNVVAFPRPDGPPNGSGPKPGRRASSRKADVLADIQSRIEAGERFESQEDLRAQLSGRFGEISKSTLSDWLGELGQSVSRSQVGRRKVVG